VWIHPVESVIDECRTAALVIMKSRGACGGQVRAGAADRAGRQEKGVQFCAECVCV